MTPPRLTRMAQGRRGRWAGGHVRRHHQRRYRRVCLHAGRATPPASCEVSVRVCDGGSPDLCATQTTTVSITPVNDAPVITSTAAITATEDVAYAYNATASDPDGRERRGPSGRRTPVGQHQRRHRARMPSRRQGPRLRRAARSRYGSATVGSPDLCATQTTTVSITAVNDAPVITSTAAATAAEDVLYTYDAPCLTRMARERPGRSTSPTRAVASSFRHRFLLVHSVRADTSGELRRLGAGFATVGRPSSARRRRRR